MYRLIFMCICIIALCTTTIANEDGNDDEAITRGNAYIDQLLKDMFQNDNEEYDPYKMEDSVVGFNKKVVFVNVTGEAKLHDGYIKGLSTLHRPSDCSLHEEGERLKVKADLGGGALDFHYSGSAKFMNFGPTITVEGNLAYIEVHLEFTVDAKTGKNGKLEKFTIDDMRGMKASVTGLGPINWAINPIISGVTKVFKRGVRYVLENKVQKYIANRLPNYQFPIEGGEETESPLTKSTEPEQTTQTTEPQTVTPEQTTQTPEPETPVPEEKETPTPEETEAPTPEETKEPTPEEPDTTASEEPETTVPEETETPVPEEPETPVPEEPETPAPEEPETPAPEEHETPSPEEPETQAPEEPETPVPDEQNELEEA